MVGKNIKAPAVFLLAHGEGGELNLQKPSNGNDLLYVSDHVATSIVEHGFDTLRILKKRKVGAM